MTDRGEDIGVSDVERVFLEGGCFRRRRHREAVDELRERVELRHRRHFAFFASLLTAR